MSLHVLVLGSAAGGGLPQWNCGCANCSAVREGRGTIRARTQDSVAVSADGEDWWLINASPDVLRQVQDNRELWPKSLRHSPIKGVILTNGDLDHVIGLLQLRESQPLTIYATARVLEGLKTNSAFRTLQRFDGHTRCEVLSLRQSRRLGSSEHSSNESELAILPFPLAGKPPLHLLPEFAHSSEDNIGLRVSSAEGATLVYASAVAQLDPENSSELDDCGALFLDGTFWSENELPALNIGKSPARSMAHLPIGGQGGSLLALASLRNVGLRCYTHINNTNPILNPESPEHAATRSAGWQIAYDGMKLTL